MTNKAGFHIIGESGAGHILTDWSDHGCIVVRPATGKAAGQRVIPMQPGLGLAVDILARPDFALLSGAEFVFRDCFRGQRFVSDGTYLRPLGGVAVVAQRTGSLAAPVSRLTLAAAAGSFVLPELPGIPATLLIAGQSQIRVEFLIRHSTATANGQVRARFGTTGSVGDNSIVNIPSGSTANLDIRGDVLLSVATATTVNTTQALAPGAATAAAVADITSNFNVAQNMAASFDITNGTVGDVFDLIFYRVTLIQ